MLSSLLPSPSRLASYRQVSHDASPPPYTSGVRKVENAQRVWSVSRSLPRRGNSLLIALRSASRPQGTKLENRSLRRSSTGVLHLRTSSSRLFPSNLSAAAHVEARVSYCRVSKVPRHINTLRTRRRAFRRTVSSARSVRYLLSVLAPRSTITWRQLADMLKPAS